MYRHAHVCRYLATMLVFILPSIAYGSVNGVELEQQYGNKVLTLRQFYPGSKLHFDSGGNLSASKKPGAWTVDGQLRVEKIALKDGVIHIEGQRLFLFYDQGTKQLRDLATISKDEAQARHLDKKFIENAVKLGKVEIDVDCGNAQPEAADITKAMTAVFLAPDEPIADAVPIYWKRWLQGPTPLKELKAEEVVNTPRPDGTTFRVGGAVSPPHVDYDPDPAYDDIARKLRYQGTVVLWLVVNKQGDPTHIRIQRALGLGLDDKAVEAVERWKFTPAKKDGEPVPVMINVEVNFRLY